MIRLTEKSFPEILILLTAILMLVVHHVFAYSGHYGYDDMHYAKLANELLHGRMDFDDHYSFRWPILILTALSFKVFGINDFAAALPSFFVSIGTLYLVFSILKPFGIHALIFGLSITVLDGWSLHYSDKIMPDVYINLAILLMIYFIYKNKFSLEANYPILYSLGFALSFLFGFMAKESILLILPLLIYLFIVDILSKRDISFWKYSIAFGILAFAIYFGFIAYLTGSPVQRFAAIYQNSYLSLCSYDQQSLVILLKRISYQFIALLINSGMIIAPGILLLAILMQWKKDILLFKNQADFFKICFLLLLLACNFMSTSPTSYNPLCLDPRHYMFLIPIAAIAISPVLSEMLVNRRSNLLIFGLLIFIFIVSFNHSRSECEFLYLPMILLFGLNVILYKSNNFNSLFPYVFVAILCFKLLDNIRFAQEINYEAQKKVVIDYFIKGNNPKYVITDDVQKRLGDYYNGFGTKSDTRFIKFDSFSFDTLDKSREKYVLLNGYTQELSNLISGDLPYYIGTQETNSVIYKNDTLHMSILKLDHFTEPVKLVNFETGFESIKDSIDYYGNSISDEQKENGLYSNKIDEFSFSYKNALDSFHLKPEQRLLIQLNLGFWKDQASKALIVISIDENDKPYIYETQSCDHYVRAYSNWNQAKWSLILEAKKIKPGSVLKIYIWNPEKKQMFMDDFGVKISEIQ